MASSIPRRPTQAQLDEADLVGAQLGGRVLKGLSLAGRDLTGADLSASILADVDLSGATLNGADLADAELDRAKFVGASLTQASLLRARGEAVDFSSADLSGASLVNADLSRSRLVGATLARVDADAARFDGVSALGADFREARLTGAEFGEADLAGALLNDADLSGARLEGAAAAAADFRGATLLKARLDGAVLTGAMLEGADLRRAVLSRAELTDVVAESLRASGAVARKLVGASPELVALLESEGAKLGAGFLGQLIQGLKKQTVDEDLQTVDPVEDAPAEDAPAEEPPAEEPPEEAPAEEAPAVDEPSEEPEGAEESEPSAGLLGRLAGAFSKGQRPETEELLPGASLAGRDLRRVKLSGLDLSESDLSDCRLDGADLTGTDLSGATLDRARLDRARLDRAVLTGAVAERARFDDASLRSADLTGLKAPSASFIGANFSGVRFSGTDLSAADLSAARLADVDLADTDLSQALMEQADLAGADLSRAIVQGTEIDGALGLSSEALSALSERGARVGGLSLARLLEGVGTARLFQGAAVVIAASLVGYLGWRFTSDANVSSEVLETDAADAVASGETDEALERYGLLVEKAEFPVDRVTYRFERSALLVEAEREDDALAELEAAIEDATGEGELHFEARLKYARLLDRLEQPKRSAGVYEELAGEEVAPELLAQALVGLSGAYRALEKSEEALAVQREVLERYPNNPGLVVAINISMSEMFTASGEYTEALTSLKRIEEYPLDDDQRASLMVAQARTHDALGDSAAALSYYKQLLARYPTYDEASGELLLSMASLFARERDSGEARALLTRLDERGGAPQVLARGLLLSAQLDEEEQALSSARERYTAVIERYPEDAVALETARLGLVRIILAENPDADVRAELSIEGGDDELAAQVVLGQAQQREDVGDIDGASALYQRVLVEFPNALGAGNTARFRQASLLANGEQYAEAINAFRELLSAASDQDTKTVIESNMAEVYLLAGRVGDAETIFESLLNGAEPDSEAAGLANIGLGRVATARGETEGARRRFRTVVDESADPALTSTALELLADSFLTAGEDDEAMAVYTLFLKTLPAVHDSAFTTRRAVAGILERRGEHTRALDIYEALIEEDPNAERRIGLELSRADLLESSGDSAGARAAYQVLLDGRGMDVTSREDAVLGLMRSTQQIGESEAVLALGDRYEERFQTPTARASLLQLRAQALRSLGRIEEAEAYSEQILSLSGDVGDAAFSAMMERANTRMNEGEFEESIRIYSELLAEVEDRPTAAALKNSIAQVRMASGDLDGAAEAFEAVLEEYGGLSEARFSAGMGLADVDRARGEPEAAVARYEALEVPDAGSEIWRLTQLAGAKQASGDDDGAEAIYKTLIQDHANNAQALSAGRMGLADLLHAKDEFAAARSLYQRVARESSDPTQREWASLRVANTLSDEGSLDRARAALATLLEDARDPEVQLQARLGQSSILLEQDKAREALDLLDGVDASALGPAWVSALVQQQVACMSVLGEHEAASAAWTEVLERWGELDDAASLARLGLGDLSVDRGEFDEARTWYDAVLSASGDRHYQARAVLGEAGAWRAAGDNDKARAAFSRLVKDYPEQGELVETANQELARLSN